MRILLMFLLLSLALAGLGCDSRRAAAARLVREGLECREAGDLKKAEALLWQATEACPVAEEPWLELGILRDEYLKTPEDAVACYENFLMISKNREMRERVEGWLRDARQGVALPLTEVAELSPEAQEILDRRTAQYEELRRNLVNRYESELDKYRGEGEKAVTRTLVVTQYVEAAAAKDSQAGEKAAAEAEKLAAEKLAAEKAKAEAEVEKAKAEKLAAEKAQAEAEKAEAEKLAAEKAQAEAEAEARRLAEEKAEAERQAKALAEQKAREAEEARKAHAAQLDAFVKDVVSEGQKEDSKVVVTASNSKEAQEAALGLELSEDEEEAGEEVAKKSETEAGNAGYPAETKVAQTEKPAEASAGKTEKAEKPGEKPGLRYHVVGPGDNLGNISRKYYGEFKRWKEIHEANKDILPDPNKLKVGMKLVIPE